LIGISAGQLFSVWLGDFCFCFGVFHFPFPEFLLI